MDRKTTSDPLRRRLRRLGRGERIEEARAFIRRFHRERGLPESSGLAREREIVRSLRRYGWYDHTPEELAFGARLAWRHSARCIGRLYWRSLEVIDARTVKAPEEVASAVCSHLKTAFNEGKIRSMITIFSPVRGEELPTSIESRQALQYAGWVIPGQGAVGDPLNIEVTRIVEQLGWKGGASRSPFEILPLLIRDARQRRSIHAIPPDVVNEVRIEHPEFPAFSELGLRWYAIPCITSMIMTIGGIDYPCAPFNGHYMGTEIASRNLADERRYDRLPKVAEILGLNIRPDPPLWKDRALLALNEAVLWSYERAGVRMADHHTESHRYMEFVERERSEGRNPAGDWAWITPPQAAPACPVFHMQMNDHHPVPAFYRDRGTDGALLRPDYSEMDRWRHADRWDRLRYRWRRWWRRRDGLHRRS